MDQKNVECNPNIFRANRNEWTGKPRLFEIGNDGPVNISHEPNEFLDAQTSGRSIIGYVDYILSKIPNFVMTAVMLISLPLLLIVFFTPKKHHPVLKFVTTVAILFVLGIYCLLEWYSGIELVSFTNGTSMWPSVIMKFLAISLSAYFFFRIHKKILEDRRNIEKNYLILEKPEKNLSKQFLLWLKETKLSLAILITSIFCDRSYKKRKRIFFDDWGKTYSQKMHFSRLWSEYLGLSKWRFALIRIIPALAITVLLC